VNASATGIHILASSYNTVDSNSIDGTGRWGVDLYPTDQNSLQGNVISNNLLRNTSQQTNDTGAIISFADAYGNSDYLNESVTITGNRIENVGGIVRDSLGNFQKGLSQGIYMDDQVGGATITKNVIETGSGTGILLCHGCHGNVADNNVIILQSAAFYDRGIYGVSRSTGDMAYNGVTRVDLLPSYFPVDLDLSTIVVGLSGTIVGGVVPAFTVLADGVPVGSGLASNEINHYEFLAPLTPHQIHAIAIQLTNGADQGLPKAGLQNLTLFVNGTGVQIADPLLIVNSLGSFGFAAGNDSLPPTNFSFTHNIVYQNAGTSADETDWTDLYFPGYLDPNPGTIDFNVLSPGVSIANDPIFGNVPLEEHSLVSVDPAFVNPAIGDYTLQSKSPALSLGFSTSGVPLAP
jgi:parallel beta-helix repeat protein